jgi:hypothetical protein
LEARTQAAALEAYTWQQKKELGDEEQPTEEILEEIRLPGEVMLDSG